MSSTRPAAERGIACSLAPAELGKRTESLSRFAGEALSSTELDDGFALVYSFADETVARLVEAIVFERRCCTFLRFELVFEPQQGPVRLRIRGPEEAKDLIRPLLAG